MVFQNFEGGVTDRAAWERDIALGGLTGEQAETSMRLFAGEVLPEHQSRPTH